MAQSLQKSLNQGHSFSLGHFFLVPSHIILLPLLGMSGVSLLVEVTGSR